MITETDRTLKPIAEYNMTEGNITFGVRIKLRQRISQWDVSLTALSQQEAYLAPYAYDGNKFTSSWRSLNISNAQGNFITPEWLQIDTHTSPIINQIKVYKHNLKTFKVQTSNNGIDWQDFQSKADNTRTENLFTFTDTSFRYYRFLINSIQSASTSAMITEIILYRIIEISKDNLEEDDSTALNIRREKESDSGLISLSEFDLTLDNSQGNYSWINQAIRGANTEITIEVSYRKWDGIGDPTLDLSWAKEYYPLIQGYLNNFTLNANNQTVNIRGRDVADKFNVINWTSPMYDNLTALELIKILANNPTQLPSGFDYDDARPDIEIKPEAKQLVSSMFLDNVGTGKAGVVWEGFTFDYSPYYYTAPLNEFNVDPEDNRIWFISQPTVFKITQQGQFETIKTITLFHLNGYMIAPNGVIYDYNNRNLWYLTNADAHSDTNNYIITVKLNIDTWTYTTYPRHKYINYAGSGIYDGTYIWESYSRRDTPVPDILRINKVSPDNYSIVGNVDIDNTSYQYFHEGGFIIGTVGKDKEWLVLSGTDSANKDKLLFYNKNTQVIKQLIFTQNMSNSSTSIIGGLIFRDAIWIIGYNRTTDFMYLNKCAQLQFNLSQSNIQSIDNPPNNITANFERPIILVDNIEKDNTGTVTNGVLTTDDLQLNYETGELHFFLPPDNETKITAKYDYLFSIPFAFFEDKVIFEAMQEVAETKEYVISVSEGTFNMTDEDDNEAKLLFRDNLNERDIVLKNYLDSNKYQIKDANDIPITYLIEGLETVTSYNPDKDTCVPNTYTKGIDYEIDYVTGQIWWLTGSAIQDNEVITIIFYCEPTYEFSYDSNMTSLNMSWGRDKIINKVTVEGERRFPSDSPLITTAIYAVTTDDKLIDTKFENVKQLQTISTKDAQVWKGYLEAWTANAIDRDLEVEFDNKFIGIKSTFDGTGGFPDKRIRVRVTPVDIQSETGNQVGIGMQVNWEGQENKEVIESFGTTQTKLDVLSLKVDHRGLQIEVDNQSTQIYFLKIEIQAYPVCLVEKPIATHIDYISTDKYGIRTKDVQNSFLTDATASKWLARHIIKLNSVELPQTSITVLGSAFLQLGDIVKVREINSGTDGYFEVISLNHTFGKDNFLTDCDLRLIKWIAFV